ncbi:MAG: 16S rRNA (guanine(527)-N(7))-methyltransferase RsmG [Gammaproteobacteria bacterium]|nr:16S rRNA (guanine(527)-N(7))-methyltransferase RsmG [Gammaproteobacteria bacterium]
MRHSSERVLTNSDNVSGIIAAGAKELGLSLEASQIDRLNRYVASLYKWNQVYNLTSVRRPDQIAVRHILDSLAVWPHVRGQRVLDVGSGAGLPGIPLAILMTDKQFVLIDSIAKKTRFMLQAVLELGLPNVEVVQHRVEDYRTARPFDTIVSRAFSSIREMLELTQEVLAPGGVYLALKGAYPEHELAELPAGFGVTQMVPLKVPGLDAERHVVCIERT